MVGPTPNPITRWIAICLLSLTGLALMFCGMVAPAHLRALDARIVAQAGLNTLSLVDQSIALLNAGRIGQARLLLHAAKQCQVPNTEPLERALAAAASWQATNQAVSELELILRDDPWALKWDGRPVMALLAPRPAREKVRAHLATSIRSGVLECLKTRDLTNLVYFPPANSASGQPYEAACLVAGLLTLQEHIPASLREDIESRAYGATRKDETQPLEHFYLDLVSLGNRMNWAQLIDLMNGVPDLASLKDLANLARHKDDDWRMLFAAAHLHGAAPPVIGYVFQHAVTGMDDLKFSLRHGRGALDLLLQRGQRLNHFDLRDRLSEYDPVYTVFITWLRLARHSLALALALKYTLVLAGAFLLGRALIDLMPAQDGIAVKRWLSPAHLSLAGALVLLVFALVEPFLFQQNQTLSFPSLWKFPMVGENVREIVTQSIEPMLDLLTIVALVFFLVVQAVIYILCLLKLAEIRRQPVASSVKLKLLENEENMFDLGLYCGLGGTVASLVLLAMGVIKPSLMAAYASTLFGILFVAVLKVCHLRPLRRKLIIESETQAA